MKTKIPEIETKLGESLENFLKREYLTNKKSTCRISVELSVNSGTISKWLDKYNIRTRSISEALLTEKGIKPTKEQLEERIKNNSLRDVAKYFGISQTLVFNLLNEFNINFRKGVESKIPSREELEKLYSTKSSNEIAQEFGVKRFTVVKWLKKYNIHVRSFNEEYFLLNGIEKPTKELLKKLYCSGKKPTTQIGKEIGVSSTTIAKWLNEYNIPIRSHSEAKLSNGIIRPSREELERLYNKGKNFEEIAKKYGVSSTAIREWFDKHKIQTRAHKSYDNRPFRKKISDRVLKLSKKQPEQLLTYDFHKIKQNDGYSCKGVITWYMRKYNCKPSEARDKLVEDLYGIKLERNKKIKTREQFLEFLKQDKTARKLTIAAASLNGQGIDIEQTILDIYDDKFKDQSHLHKLIQESSKEVYKLIEEGFTNLGDYIGNFSLRDRKIIPFLVGGAVDSIPDGKLNSSLEAKLVRVLRSVYSPKFNDNPNETVMELEDKTKQIQGKKKRLYEKLHSHYKEVLKLSEELQ